MSTVTNAGMSTVHRATTALIQGRAGMKRVAGSLRRMEWTLSLLSSATKTEPARHMFDYYLTKNTGVNIKL